MDILYKDITKNNLYATASGCTARVFKNETIFNEWLEYTQKNGHDMISFYKIKFMVSQYHTWTKEEFNQLLNNN